MIRLFLPVLFILVLVIMYLLFKIENLKQTLSYREFPQPPEKACPHCGSRARLMYHCPYCDSNFS
ncbi:MAG: hypothetical protein LBH21_06195 [Gracilibacteraceae bacterium]|jgi:hypothetical protein|nr:hypothetical protein [Gracilibacteraceae bacterium]